MKKIILTLSFLAFLGLSTLHAQVKVGDNPTSIDASAALEVESTTKGFLPPRMTVTERNAIVNPEEGLMIFNTTSGCPNYFANGVWQEWCGTEVRLISGLNCAGATVSGPLFEGVDTWSKSFAVGYTDGRSGSHNGQTVHSTGVTGITATLSSGSFANGSGTLTYDLDGIPSAQGTASFALDIGRERCVLNIPVETGSISSLNCQNPTINGSLVDGVPASSNSFEVQYNGGNGGPHNGQTVHSTGVTGLTATLLPGSFSLGVSILPYTISGTPSGSGTASFALDIGGQSCTVDIPVETGSISSLDCQNPHINGSLVDGVPASNSNSFEVQYNGGNGGSHNGQIVNSTGVTGLTATLQPGSFSLGVSGLTYTISGTPSGSGTASFALNIGGQSCTLQVTVQ